MGVGRGVGMIRSGAGAVRVTSSVKVGGALRNRGVVRFATGYGGRALSFHGGLAELLTLGH